MNFAKVYWFFNFFLKFPFSSNYINISSNSNITIGKNVSIKRSKILIGSNSKLIIGDNSNLMNIKLIVNGNCFIGKNNILSSDSSKRKLGIRINGLFNIGDCNKIQSTVWMRYNSSFIMGNYNNINAGSEIRVDESIKIGSFNQISYNVMVWDTNTHNIYESEFRRELTVSKFPQYGYEYEKPKTSPVSIGDDNWIGKDVAVLRGTSIANKCIIGFRTVLINKLINDSTTVVQDIPLKYIFNNL